MFKVGDLVQLHESTGGNPPGMVYNQTYVVIETYRRGIIQYVSLSEKVKDLDTYRTMDKAQLDKLNAYEYNEIEVFAVHDNTRVKVEGNFFD